MRCYWFKFPGGILNFGDDLNPLILTKLEANFHWARPVEAELVMVGSILEHLPTGWAGTVCGAGKLHEGSQIDLSDARVFALRGKLTQAGVTGLRGPIALGDPALLLPKWVRQGPAKHGLGVVPHWSDTELHRRFSYGRLIDVRQPPEKVIQEIISCKRIISSSLHGVVVADAYGIPRQAELPPVSVEEGKGKPNWVPPGDFKWRDYTSVFDEHPHFGHMHEVPRHKVEGVQDALLPALRTAIGIDLPSPADRRDPLISFLVPFRDDGEHRTRVWRWLRQYWRCRHMSAEIIQGHSSDYPFSKSKAVNLAASIARGRVFVILDADAYLDPQVLVSCAEKIEAALSAGHHLWFMPYTRLYRLNQRCTLDWLKTNPNAPAVTTPPSPGCLDKDTPPQAFSNGHQFGAMCQVMPREAFYAVNGFDPGFKGWGCTDEKTEILTDQGWKRYQDVKVGDPVLTLDHRTGLSEWKPIQKMNVYRDGPFKMVAIKSTHHSSFTTMNHRWPVIARNGDRVWRTTETLNIHDRVPISAICADLPTQPVHDDALVELVAWLLTEGWLKPSKRSVGITQSHVVHPEFCAQIESALVRAFGEPSRGVRVASAIPPAVDSDLVKLSELVARYGICRETIQLWCRSGKISAVKVPGGGGHGTWLVDRRDAEAFIQKWRVASWWRRDRERDATFNLNPEAGDILLQHAPGKVPSFEFLLSLTQHQLDLFIDVAMKGDGCVRVQGDNRRPTRVFEQRDRRAAEAFAFAVILSGSGVSIRLRNQNAKGDRTSGTPRELDYAMTVVHIRHRDRISPITPSGYAHSGNRQYEIVDYDGPVWCPTTENGTWLARREGSVYWTGNSEDASVLRALDTLWGLHEVADDQIVHFWHERMGSDWRDRRWEGQAWTTANSRLAQRYALAAGEEEYMQALVDEHPLSPPLYL